MEVVEVCAWYIGSKPPKETVNGLIRISIGIYTKDTNLIPIWPKFFNDACPGFIGFIVSLVRGMRRDHIANE